METYSKAFSRQTDIILLILQAENTELKLRKWARRSKSIESEENREICNIDSPEREQDKIPIAQLKQNSSGFWMVSE